MDQPTTINIESVVLRRKRRAAKKISIGLLVVALVFAAFFFWWHFNHVRIVQRPATAEHTTSVATAPAPTRPVTTLPATVKPELADGSPKIDDRPALTTSDHQVTTNAATVGFADSMMAVLSPSAKAETIQQEMQPAPKPARRTTIQTAAFFSSLDETQGMTFAQKQLKVAQDGFSDVMDQAHNYPDTYGFSPDENLKAARLGDAIPVYRIALQDREKYAGQPVSSLLKPSDEWVYPIILENRIRYFVEVRYDGHGFVRELGSRALAMAYDKILARWPASEGFHPKLITVPNQSFYYFTIPELPDQNITDTSRMFDMNPALSPASLVLADLF